MTGATAIYIALGGAVGALVRFGLVSTVTQLGFYPWGTWIANVSGSFAIGAVMGAYGEAAWFEDFGRPLVVVGFLGAFTTFSAFSHDVWNLVGEDRVGMAFVYVLASVGLSLGAAWTGMRSFGS